MSKQSLSIESVHAYCQRLNDATHDIRNLTLKGKMEGTLDTTGTQEHAFLLVLLNSMAGYAPRRVVTKLRRTNMDPDAVENIRHTISMALHEHVQALWGHYFPRQLDKSPHAMGVRLFEQTPARVAYTDLMTEIYRLVPTLVYIDKDSEDHAMLKSVVSFLSWLGYSLEHVDKYRGWVSSAVRFDVVDRWMDRIETVSSARLLASINPATMPNRAFQICGRAAAPVGLAPMTVHRGSSINLSGLLFVLTKDQKFAQGEADIDARLLVPLGTPEPGARITHVN